MSNESIKNRDIFPIGTRVKPAFDKITNREGLVVGHTKLGDIDMMYVVWDGQLYPGTFMKSELRFAGFAN